jgi:methane/ammonia monooxygenase subunit B
MMESKTLFVMALATVIAMFAITSAAPQEANAHGVQAQLQSRFVRIDNEQFSDNTLNTGHLEHGYHCSATRQTQVTDGSS